MKITTVLVPDALLEKQASAVCVPLVQNWPPAGSDSLANGTRGEQAVQLVHLLLASNEEDGSLFDWATLLDPTALANQFTFAIEQSPADEEEGERSALIAIITPTVHWEATQCCFDKGSPIQHLLPEDSEYLNECGTWAIPGFDTATGLMQFLVTKGFRWDASFQEFIDPTMLEDLRPLAESDAQARPARNRRQGP